MSIYFMFLLPSYLNCLIAMYFFSDNLVSFGGIAGLFLGFSLLTIIEFVYWGIKLLIYQYNIHSMSRNKISPEY